METEIYFLHRGIKRSPVVKIRKKIYVCGTPHICKISYTYEIILHNQGSDCMSTEQQYVMHFIYCNFNMPA